jgi:hypothetical protein
MKIKTTNIKKTQDDHPHQALLTPRRSSLSVPLVRKVPRKVRNSLFQFPALFLRIISI